MCSLTDKGRVPREIGPEANAPAQVLLMAMVHNRIILVSRCWPGTERFDVG
jgi:hypothetical protein